MSLISTLTTGVSGVITNSRALNIIGDNISNVNTTGFKSSQAVFGDLFSTSLNGGTLTSQVGKGTQLLGSLQSFEQGAFENTSSALDLAVDGNGFFVVNDGVGDFYTRAGQFRINEDGFVETLTGEVLQGFEITNNVVGNTLTGVDLSSIQSAPEVTTEFTLSAQLDGSETTGFTFSSPIQIYNSVGTQDILTITFTKNLTTNNLWDYTLASQEGVLTGITAGQLAFDTSGQLLTADGGTADLSIDIDYAASAPPGAAQTVIWNMFDLAGATTGDLTGFDAPSSNNTVVQDGFGSGILIGVAVDFDGTVAGLFNNGASQDLYQLGLANFLSPTGLTRMGQNLFAESRLSGQPVISFAESGAMGSVLGNTLELSNVDLADQFVRLIKTQQAFQASARVISTTDDLLTETVNLTR